MTRLPKTTYQPIGFRGPASSTSQNDFQEELFEDMMALYEEANEIREEVKMTKEAVDLSDMFLYGHVRKLENRLHRLEDLLDKIDKRRGYRTAFAFTEDMKEDMLASTDERIHIDTLHQIAHLPIAGKKLSKLHQRNAFSNAQTLPEDLSIKVLPETQLGWIIEENDIKQAVDGKEGTYWRRRVMVPIEDSNKRMIHEVIITLPDTTIFNRQVNMLTINPFPAHSMNIDKVEYSSGGSWQLLPGWGAGEDRASLMRKDVGNIKLCFPEISIVDIRITLSQENWFEEDGRKVFHFGLKEVGVHHVDYATNVGRFEALITLTSDADTKIITGIKPVFANEDALTDDTIEKLSIFNYDIYTVKENGDVQYTKDRFPITVNENKILIKGSINQDPENKGTPALQSIELTYEDV